MYTSSLRFKYEPSSMEEYSQTAPMAMGFLNTKIAIELAKNKNPSGIESEFTKMGMKFLEEQLRYPINSKEKVEFEFLLNQRLVRDQRYDEIDFKKSLEYLGPLVEESHAKSLDARRKMYRDFLL